MMQNMKGESTYARRVARYNATVSVNASKDVLSIGFIDPLKVGNGVSSIYLLTSTDQMTSIRMV